MEKINLIIDKIKDMFDRIDNLSFLNKTPSKKFLITAFSVVIVLIASFSLITVVSENKDRNAGEEDTSSSSEEVPVIASAPSQELLGNFLLVLTEDGNKKIELLALARLDSLNKKVSISFIKPSVKVKVNGFEGTMQQHLENGGINELMWSVGHYAGISIERYIFGDEQNFIDFMKKLGDIELKVEEKISHSHRGIDFIIDAGTQSFSADMMLKYFVYLCENYETLPDRLIETMITYGKIMFDSTADAYLDQSFNSLIKCFETDISVVDFTNYKSAVKSLASSEQLVEISIETDASKLK